MKNLQLTSQTHSRKQVFEAMFRARKEVFIDLLRWDLPGKDGGHEIDGFDDADARYLLLLGPGCRHLASARLLRTDRDHLLRDHFAHLSAGPVPSGPTVREITRFCLDRKRTDVPRRRIRNQLVSALADHALAEGITTYTGVAEFAWFEQIRSFGWKCRALGQPVREGASRLVGLEIEISRDTPRLLESKGIYEDPASYRSALRVEDGQSWSE